MSKRFLTDVERSFSTLHLTSPPIIHHPSFRQQIVRRPRLLRARERARAREKKHAAVMEFLAEFLALGIPTLGLCGTLFIYSKKQGIFKTGSEDGRSVVGGQAGTLYQINTECLLLQEGSMLSCIRRYPCILLKCLICMEILFYLIRL